MPGPTTYKLLECKWRNVSFPINDLTTSSGQTLVKHQFPDRDGAWFESTGREPIIVSVKAMFLNTILPAASETWKAGALFPAAYNSMMAAVKDKSVGLLQHPSYGTFNAKVETWTANQNAQNMSGATMDITFVETIAPDLTDTVVSGAGATAIATALDTAIANAKPMFVPPATSPASFADLIGSVVSFIDKSSLLLSQVDGTFDQVLFHLDRLKTACDMAGDNVVESVHSKAEFLEDMVREMQANFNAVPEKSIRVYYTQAPFTIERLSHLLKNSLEDLIALNHDLFSQLKGVVPDGTFIRYYQQAAK